MSRSTWTSPKSTWRCARGRPGRCRPSAIRLFGERLTPVASPWLLKSGPPLKKPADLARFALIEDAHPVHQEWATWRRWFDDQGLTTLQPQRWLYFNYSYQMVQAALTGQGVVLARLPLVAESLANGDLVEPLPGLRLDSPNAYWLVLGPRAQQRPQVKAFCAMAGGAGPGHAPDHRRGRRTAADAAD